MADNDDDIPVLTEAVEPLPAAAAVAAAHDLARLEARLCASSLKLAEQLLRDACREAEHVLLERVMNELRAELPAIVKRALDEHFDR